MIFILVVSSSHRFAFAAFAILATSDYYTLEGFRWFEAIDADCDKYIWRLALHIPMVDTSSDPRALRPLKHIGNQEIQKRRRVESLAEAAPPRLEATLLENSSEPPFELWAQTGRVWVKSVGSSNKKVGKDLVYKTWTDGDFKKASEISADTASYAYDLSSSTTLVYAMKEQKVMTLKKFIKDCHPLTTHVYGERIHCQNLFSLCFPYFFLTALPFKGRAQTKLQVTTERRCIISVASSIFLTVAAVVGCDSIFLSYFLLLLAMIMIRSTFGVMHIRYPLWQCSVYPHV